MVNIQIDRGGGPGMNGLGGFGLPGGPEQAMMMVMQCVMQILSMVMGGGAGMLPMAGGFGGEGPGFGGNPGGGGFGPSEGITNFLGAGPGGPMMSPVNPGMPGAPGSGQAAIDLARRYLGRDSIGLRGDMPHFTAAGGVTNNCADFVSSALESQGLLGGHHINVNELEQSLKAQGYRQIPASEAQPGDVWINHSRGHTELVATPGARTLIGSNGSARQRVSEHQNNPGSGVYYTRR
ncbi:MAG: peptidoglycan amidohydrolase family protein [Vulcanimicrobiota bacterium]